MEVLSQFDDKALDKSAQLFSMAASIIQNIKSQFPGEESKAIDILVELLQSQKV